MQSNEQVHEDNYTQEDSCVEQYNIRHYHIHTHHMYILTLATEFTSIPFVLSNRLHTSL